MSAKPLRWRRGLAALVAIGALVGAAACGSDDSKKGSNNTPAAPAAPASTFVVFGEAASAPSSDAIPISESWPQWFFRRALPRDMVFVNLSTQVASTSLALRNQLPIAQQLKPTIAAVLLGFAEADAQLPPAEFASTLDDLVAGVRAAGARTVLVGTLPDELPNVAAYNDEIAAVARRQQAVLVDLVPLDVSFLNEPDVRGNSPTEVPDRASQRAIADAFTNAYRAATAPAQP